MKIFLILLLGALLRFYGIVDKPFHEDESYTLNQILNLSTHQLAFTIFDPGVMPLYYLITKFVAGVLGVSEFSLRLPSALASTSSIWFIYKIGKFWRGEAVGWMAAALLACAPLSIVYAQSARAYGLFELLTVISFYFFLQCLETRKTIYLLGFFLFSFLGLATHGLFSIFFLAEMLFLFFQTKQRKEILKWVFGLALFSVLFYLTLSHRFEVAFHYKSDLGTAPPTLLIRILVAFFGFALGETTTPFNGWVVIPSALLFGAAFAAGIYGALRERQRWDFLVLASLFFPLMVWLSVGLNYPRYLGFLLPFFLLLVALGIDFFPLCLVFLIIPQTVSSYYWYSGNPNQVTNANLLVPWKEIVLDIQSKKRPGEMVLLHPDFNIPLIQYYSDPKESHDFIPLPEENDEEPLAKIFQMKPNSLWLLSGPNSSREKKIKMDDFRCYQTVFHNGYVLNPILSEHVKTGVQKFSYAAELFHFQRKPGCFSP